MMHLYDALIITHWGRDKMAAILQATFQNSLRMKIAVFDSIHLSISILD